MTPQAKEIPNEAVHRQESLRVSGGFEPPHLSLALAGRLMRDFGSIVLVLRRAVHNGRHHDAVGRRVAAKLVGDQTPWRTADRKSTRLNSSHVRISYAVFCLKKKDIMQHHQL